MLAGVRQPPLSPRVASEHGGGVPRDSGFEAKRWKLCKIEVIDNTELISTGRPIPNCAGQYVSLASVECAFDSCRRSVPKTLPINVSDDGAELQLHISDPLPDNFGSWQEPRGQEGRRVGLSTKLAKRDANDLGHARAARS